MATPIDTCEYCESCENCDSCVKCKVCKNSNHCLMCTNADNCKECKYTNNSNDCFKCVSCNRCHNCKLCIHCTNCDNLINSGCCINTSNKCDAFFFNRNSPLTPIQYFEINKAQGNLHEVYIAANICAAIVKWDFLQKHPNVQKNTKQQTFDMSPVIELIKSIVEKYAEDELYHKHKKAFDDFFDIVEPQK